MTRISPKPLPTPLAMSTAPAEATPSPLPRGDKIPSSENQTQEQKALRPHPKPPAFPKPKVRFECRQLDHDGASVFFNNINIAHALSDAVSTVLSTLYTPSPTNDDIPATRSVNLILRSMDGVAYTTGNELDNDHKEIHFSLDYIKGIPDRDKHQEKHEIQGVLVHEMVHCWQWNGKGSAPGGLIEGIADYVRLKAGLSPSRWKKETDGQWDAGYQHTAYFLEWIEGKMGEGSVRKINDTLRLELYDEKMWDSWFGKTVQALWAEYQEGLKSTSS